jgi:hypothetical protein
MSDADLLEKPEIDTILDEDDTLFCAACGAPVTRERHAVARRGDHEHTVFNPSGRLFVIRCFSEANGVRRVGAATDAFTWFPNHPWRLGLCAGCAVHLGWFYEGPDGVFHGLIKPAITRSRR